MSRPRGCLPRIPLLPLFLTAALLGPVAYSNRDRLAQLTESLPDNVRALVPAAPTPPVETCQVGDISCVILGPTEFVMGSPQDEPGHRADETQRTIRLSRYAISQCEVTQQQYWALLDPSTVVSPERASLPITNVTWDEAAAFCEALSDQQARRIRLPSEAEWEYACRGGDQNLFANWDGDVSALVANWQEGDSSPLIRRATSLCNFDSFGPAQTATFPPNAFGLHDMHGNVWEWCDQSDEASSLMTRPIRGGAWSSPSCLDCRAANRAWQQADQALPSIGFRIVLELP